MADAQWWFGNQSRYPTADLPPLPPHVAGKRYRSDFEMLHGPETHDMSRRFDGIGGHNIFAAYELPPGAPHGDLRRRTDNMHYDSIMLRGDERGRPPVNPPHDYYQHRESSFATTGAGESRSGVSLPPDACNTLFVKGFPLTCTKREASHIFRPLMGFKDLRIVTKESRHPDGGLVALCYVEFYSATYAAVAMDTLQGYKFDMEDSDSPHLKLQFFHSVARLRGGHHHRP